MQANSNAPGGDQNVINLFTGKSLADTAGQAIVNVLPETSGLRMLYASPSNPDRLVAIPLLCWGMRADGEIVGLVTWINEIIDCTTLDEAMDVCWEGYYDEANDMIFYEAPESIVAQLTVKARFAAQDASCRALPLLAVEGGQYGIEQEAIVSSSTNICEEIPDLVGTHALLQNDDENSLTLTPVVSWMLGKDGELHGMLVDEDSVDKTPVLPGDECLYAASSNPNFRCYFQRDIAEQIRLQNPETMAAIEQLLST